MSNLEVLSHRAQWLLRFLTPCTCILISVFRACVFDVVLSVEGSSGVVEHERRPELCWSPGSRLKMWHH